MRIVGFSVIPHAVPLSRPYVIAGRSIDAVEIFYLEVLTDRPGLTGLGAASPAPAVTGESAEACVAALRSGLDFLRGADPRRFAALQTEAAVRLASTPAALAACDMALWDLAGKILEVPAVDLLGTRQEALPTSITVGIKSTEAMKAEAMEYLEQGFRALKIKIGTDFAADAQRLAALRLHLGEDIRIRVDANQGYAVTEPDLAEGLLQLVRRFDIELVEQPVPRGAGETEVLRSMGSELLRGLAADESLHTAKDALRIAQNRTYGILNIKLMKCGGITGGRAIATVAEHSGRRLMWGCMDESVISIAAALHVAYASPATRFLDLDGSFDLSSDLAAGGFSLKSDVLHLLDRPGLGVTWAHQA
ncbi:MAG: dipeptide epimerase [Acidobacteriota bacterium]